jgi:hypothetical protein
VLGAAYGAKRMLKSSIGIANASIGLAARVRLQEHNLPWASAAGKLRLVPASLSAWACRGSRRHRSLWPMSPGPPSGGYSLDLIEIMPFD